MMVAGYMLYSTGFEEEQFNSLLPQMFLQVNKRNLHAGMRMEASQILLFYNSIDAIDAQRAACCP